VARDTLIDFFNDLARAEGEFLVYDDGFRARSWTYQDVGRAARALALRLRAEGLEKGDKVVFYSENRPEWIVAFWACLLNGIIVVPLDFRSSPPFLLRVSRIVHAKLILIGEDVPRLDDTGGVPVWRLAGSDLVFQHSGPNVETQDLTPITRDDVAEIIFTSGATADPKGVVITHRNVLANIVPVEREVLKHRKWGRPFFPLRFLNLLPLSHMFGQAMATFIPPMLPGTVIFMRGYNPADIAAQIKSRRVSVLVSVPKILEVLKEYVGRASQARQEGGPKRGALQGHILTRTLRRWWHYRHVHRIFGWKFWAFVVGAAPLETELEAFWGEMGFAVIQGYGLTETAPIVTLNHPFGTKRGSVGKAIAGVEMKIAPDGEILVRGDNVTTGYVGAGAEAASAFEDGWFHTGDIGELSEDGQLFIRGRKKEMIVTPEGLNVFPDDVERVLNRQPGVREAAVVGGDKNDRVHAVLVVESEIAIDDIVRRANAELADHQKIRRAVAWPDRALPRTEGTG
jgi:long-chain acyl-CoA synthetase